jgi:hypothetical protein
VYTIEDKHDLSFHVVDNFLQSQQYRYYVQISLGALQGYFQRMTGSSSFFKVVQTFMGVIDRNGIKDVRWTFQLVAHDVCDNKRFEVKCCIQAVGLLPPSLSQLSLSLLCHDGACLELKICICLLCMSVSNSCIDKCRGFLFRTRTQVCEGCPRSHVFVTADMLAGLYKHVAAQRLHA